MGFSKAKKTFKPKAKRTFKRKAGKRKFTRKGKNPSTGKEGVLMKDRTFDKFEIVFITDVAPPFEAGLHSIPNPADGYGMIPFFPGEFDTITGGAMYVFSPSYVCTPYNPVGPVTAAFNQMRLLPGNSLCELTPGTFGVGTNKYFSDLYHQGQPTGVAQWANLYSKYFCHGSSVDVTLVDCSVAGELVVIPICMDRASNPISDAYDLQVNHGGPFYGSNNLIDLITFASLPEEQPHGKSKYVSSAGGMDKVKIRHKMTTRKMYDDKVITADNSNSGVLSTVVNNNAITSIDPLARQWGWFIAYIPSSPIPVSTSVSTICSVQVKVTYFCELTDRIQVPFTEAS